MEKHRIVFGISSEEELARIDSALKDESIALDDLLEIIPPQTLWILSKLSEKESSIQDADGSSFLSELRKFAHKHFSRILDDPDFSSFVVGENLRESDEKTFSGVNPIATIGVSSLLMLGDSAVTPASRFNLADKDGNTLLDSTFTAEDLLQFAGILLDALKRQLTLLEKHKIVHLKFESNVPTVIEGMRITLKEIEGLASAFFEKS